VAKRAEETLAPIVLPLGQRGFDEEAARVRKNRDEEENLHQRARDGHALLAEVDLHLVAGRRLEAHRCELGRASSLAMGSDRALDRAHARSHALLGQEVGHDNGIALSSTIEELDGRSPRFVVQPTRVGPLLLTRPRALAQVPLDGHVARSDLASDAPVAPAEAAKLAHDAYRFGIDHGHLHGRAESPPDPLSNFRHFLPSWVAGGGP